MPYYDDPPKEDEQARLRRLYEEQEERRKKKLNEGTAKPAPKGSKESIDEPWSQFHKSQRDAATAGSEHATTASEQADALRRAAEKRKKELGISASPSPSPSPSPSGDDEE